MNTIQRDLIEYEGITNCQIASYKSFNQVNIEKTFCIPTEKPIMEQINKIKAEAYVKDYSIVKTPVGTSLEGQTVTGYKLLVCAEIKLKVQYVANKATQSVHTAHTTFPFCGYVVLPENTHPNTLIKPSILIEDIFSEQLDEKCIYNNITMMIVADAC